MNAAENTAEGAKRILSLLRDIEARSRDHSQAPPRELEQTNVWESIVFSVGNTRYAMPLKGVIEILNFPSSVTPVPGTHAWVRGVANIRGDLLPIIDLQSYLGEGSTLPRKRNRVLVVDYAGVYTGLLVGESVGIKHFSEDEHCNVRNEKLVSEFGLYVNGAYKQHGEVWPVFDLEALLEDQTFLVAAV